MTAFEQIKVAMDVIALIGAVLAGVYAWWSRRISARREETDALKHRMTLVEAKLETMPTSNALHEIAIAVEHLSGEMKAMCARLDGMEEIVKRVEVTLNRQEDHLLKGAAR